MCQLCKAAERKMDFTNREIATVIVFLLLLLLSFLLSKDKRSMPKAITNVAKAFCRRQILTVFIIYSIYSIMVFYLAYKIGFWDFDLIKDSFIEFLFVGIPAIFVAVDSPSEKDLFKRVFLTEIGFAAFFSFYLNLESFDLLNEIALQAVITFLTLVQVIAKNKNEYKPVYNLSRFMISAIGLFLIASLSHQLYSHFFQHDWLYELRALFLTIWFPALVLPFLLSLAYFSSFEKMFIKLKIISSDILLRHKFTLVVAFSFRIKYIKHFAGIWAFRLKDCESAKEVWKMLKTYKIDLKQQIRKEKKKAAFFKDGEGKKGYSYTGIWVDRTKLKEIKRELEFISSHQALHWRNNGIYRFDIDRLVEACTPDNCISGFHVQPDGKLWACWMSNPTGFTLGLGSLLGQYPPLRYEKHFEPTGEDLLNLSGFTDKSEACPNWMYDDKIDESLTN